MRSITTSAICGSKRASKRGLPAIVLGQELVSPEQLIASEWYEYCRRLDAFHVLGAQFHVDGRLSGQFGAHRPRGSESFDEASRHTMSLLLPHLQRALQIQLRLGLYDQVRAVTLDLLQRVGFGVLILDQARRLLFANRLAERVLEEESGLKVTKGRVCVPPGAARDFDLMVEEAARTSSGAGLGAGGIVKVPLGEGASLRLFVAPLPHERSGVGAAVPAVLVLVGDPDGAVPTPVDRLRKAFGLTRSEALLLSALLAGERLSEHAERLGISLGTARTHLKHLLAKTGHHRQVDLVRAVSSDPLLRIALAEAEPA